MRKYIFVFIISLSPFHAKADMWGNDLPLLAQIVTNTLKTLYELERQSNLMKDEMRGIKNRIHRVRTIAKVVQPSEWEKWKNPQEALRRLKLIYHTMPKKYRSEKADTIERELSRAMNMVSRLSGEARTTFNSGKELERRGKDSSPGVAQKLTASGVGTLVAMEAQSQVIQSQITSLLAQMMAEANEKETRSVATQGESFNTVSTSLGKEDTRFSSHVLALGGQNP